METDPGAGEPAPGQPQPEARAAAPPGWKAWVIIAIVVVAVVLIAAAALPALLAKQAGEAPHPIAGTVTPTPGITVPTTPARTVPSTVRTTVQGTTPAPVEAPIPAVTSTTPAVTCVPQGEPGFTVTVSPLEASAARGETVTYHMNIEAQNCFLEAVSMKLTASVLFFSQTYDLGIQEPPYPKSFEYPLTVPDSLFPGATVNGVLTSTGGGITRENQLTLHVS